MKLISSLTLAFCVCTAVFAQTHTGDITPEIDKIFAWVKPAEPGCSVAVSHNGKLVANKAYGLADLERNVPLSADSIMDAGSVRKQFVAAAILLLADEGKLSLTDDVRKHIPQLPDYGRKITIDHLLTHTSGIRDWQALLNLAGGDPTAMTMILRQREVNFAPGDEWSYSNSNYVLLPEIVARVSGMPFSEFARKRLFEPLGMKSTSHPEDPLFLIKNRALAYKKDNGQWKMDMYLGNDRGGAGGLFTTAADLAIWNDAIMTGRLSKFVSEKIQEPAVLNNGRKISYARGLNIELQARRGGRLVWHTGGAAGYSALAGHLPEQNLSIGIMCNQDGTARTTYAGRIFELFLPAEPLTQESPAPSPGVPPPGGLNGKAGTFFNQQTGEALRLGVNGNTLSILGAGPLGPIGPDRFRNLRPTLYFMSEAEFELNFTTLDQIEIKTKDGIVSRYRRAQPWTPSADDLKSFAGRFYSEELMATFDITPTKDGLSVQANGANTVEFKPIQRDVFQVSQMLIRFRRDDTGKIVGLELTNPLLRKVKFSRSDR